MCQPKDSLILFICTFISFLILSNNLSKNAKKSRSTMKNDDVFCPLLIEMD